MGVVVRCGSCFGLGCSLVRGLKSESSDSFPQVLNLIHQQCTQLVGVVIVLVDG